MRADTEKTVSKHLAAPDIDWDAVYAACAPGLLACLQRLSRDVETAEDLMQTTFQRAVTARTVPPVDQLRPWLFRTASGPLPVRRVGDSLSVSCYLYSPC